MEAAPTPVIDDLPFEFRVTRHVAIIQPFPDGLAGGIVACLTLHWSGFLHEADFSQNSRQEVVSEVVTFAVGNMPTISGLVSAHG